MQLNACEKEICLKKQKEMPDIFKTGGNMRLGKCFLVMILNRFQQNRRGLLMIPFFILCLLIISIFAKAQFHKPSKVTIRIGEALPASFYETLHEAINAKTGEATTIKLADYKDKLIILDFWATWCSPCINSLNHLEQISDKFNSKDYIVVPVTYQGAEEADPSFKKFRWNMTSIVGDTILSKIFPHTGIPHQVWIRDGKVIGIPNTSFLTGIEQNIQEGIARKKLTMVMKPNRIQINPEKEMFVNGNGGNGENILARTKHGVIAGWVNEGGVTKPTIIYKGDSTIVYAINIPPIRLLHTAFSNDYFQDYNDWIKNIATKSASDGMLIEVENPETRRNLRGPKRPKDAYDEQQEKIRSDWECQHLYSYRMIYPGYLNKYKAMSFFKMELRDFFREKEDLDAAIENRAVEFLILDAIGDLELLKTKGINGNSIFEGNYYHLKNSPMVSLRLALNSVDPDLIVLDETGFRTRLDIKLPLKINGNLTLANEELAKYNLKLNKEFREVPLLIIKDYDPSKVNK